MPLIDFSGENNCKNLLGECERAPFSVVSCKFLSWTTLGCTTNMLTYLFELYVHATTETNIAKQLRVEDAVFELMAYKE